MIDFIVYDMTHLRYFAPFTRSLTRLGFRTRWLIVVSNIKYNSINADRVNRVREIAQLSGCEIIDYFKGETGRCAVTVETGSPADLIHMKYDVVISMQHGFDYTSPDRVSPKNVLNIMWDQAYVDQHFKTKSGFFYEIPYNPVAFWVDKMDCEKIAGKRRIATVFYPEIGFHDNAVRACRTLISLGIKPVVKQRRKNQAVPEIAGCDIVYDDMWHPSESIVYPIVSEICVGFGTSAYTDAIAAGLTFVDCTAPKYSNVYVKPISSRYFHCQPGNEASVILEALSTPSDFKKMSEADQDIFVAKVMERMNVQRS